MFRTLWQNHRLAVLIFAASCLVALFFAVRLAMFTIYWSDPARRDAAIEGWQTPGYIARSWQVPRSVVADALDLDEEERKRRSLHDIAAERGIETDALVGELEAAIADFRARNQ